MKKIINKVRERASKNDGWLRTNIEVDIGVNINLEAYSSTKREKSEEILSSLFSNSFKKKLFDNIPPIGGYYPRGQKPSVTLLFTETVNSNDRIERWIKYYDEKNEVISFNSAFQGTEAYKIITLDS